MTATCPECGANEGEEQFNVVNITSPDDRELGLVRYALRCQSCGFATAFIAKENTE